MPKEELGTSLKLPPHRNLRHDLLFWALALYGILSLGSMATMGIGAGVVMAALGVALGPRDLFVRLRTALRVPIVQQYGVVTFFLFVALLSSLFVAQVAPLGYGNHLVHVNWGNDLAKSWYLAWPVLLFLGLTELSPAQRRTVIWAWLLAFGVASVIGLQEFFTGWPRDQIIPDGLTHFHATVFFGHHLSAASILIFPFFASLEALRTASIAGNRKKQVLLFAICILGFACLMASYSRTLWVALPIGLTVWFLWSLPKRLSLGLTAVLSLGIWMATQNIQIMSRFQNSGLVQRKDLWEQNLMFLKARPLTGAGWHHNLELAGFYQDAFYPFFKIHFTGHAHNNLIEMLGGTGCLGAITWLIWCFWVFVVSFRARTRGTRLTCGFFCAWIVFHLNGITQVNFWESKVLHQIMWAVAWTMVIFALRDENQPVFSEPDL